MERIEDIERDYHSLVIRLANAKKEYSKVLSKLDSEQEDILHYLEFGHPNALQMAKLTKGLVEVRKQRRIVKDGVAGIDKIMQPTQLQSIYDKYKGRNSLLDSNKNYTCRTDKIEKILGISVKVI